jgi:hypothetical protein
MFTSVYLQTTDPKIHWSAWSWKSVVGAILFHTVLYAAVFNLANFVWRDRPFATSINVRLIPILLVIMTVGFFGRYYHVQEIYRAYKNDAEKTRQHCNHVFLTWFFMA